MRLSSHTRAVLQALLVTFLWSTSWVLIKHGLREIPALTFAGLRYMIAFAILLPGLWRHRDEVRALGARQWMGLISLGVVFYTFTQGGQFLVLKYLEATTFSLLLSFTPVLVALVGAFTLKEIPPRLQWVGMAVFLTGAILYFSPLSTVQGSALGFALAAMTLLANSASALLGRSVNRAKTTSPIVVTGISMGVGALCLFTIGVGTQGLPSLSLRGWGIVVWLAVVNTALAFTLWNRTLRVLSAVESSIINNTMLIQIAVLAWLFLGETHGILSILGLLLAAVGAILAQLRRQQSMQRAPSLDR
ncbi:EamA family transporter [Candidatus Bipolaricaulota bacterium]|nr:EamA family transporter [Candidatus Bipolaricaulota bacterium]